MRLVNDFWPPLGKYGELGRDEKNSLLKRLQWAYSFSKIYKAGFNVPGSMDTSQCVSHHSLRYKLFWLSENENVKFLRN